MAEADDIITRAAELVQRGRNRADPSHARFAVGALPSVKIGPLSRF